MVIEEGTSATDQGIALLLVQLGFHAARRFADALAPLGLEPRHYGMLGRLAANEGLSQQALGETLGISPTRIVFLIDDLEQHDLVERRRNPTDRRSNSLYLTAKGRKALDRSRAIAATHEASFGGSLSPPDRAKLARLLQRVASEQGVDELGLPGPPPGRGPGPHT